MLIFKGDLLITGIYQNQLNSIYWSYKLLSFSYNIHAEVKDEEY